MARVDTTELFGGISIGGLAALMDPANPANEIITAKCSHPGCQTEYKIARFWAPLTSCDECRVKAIKADQLNKHTMYWESICPPMFGDTNKSHEDFPKAQYAETKNYMGEESLLLYGPTRSGKTRLGMLLLKRCLLQRNMKVAVMWPQQLKEVKSAKSTSDLIAKWGNYELLLLDDALLSGAHDERVTDFLKDLLDFRMNWRRSSIITSQIGGADYQEAADKFGNITRADKARIDALIARVRETFRKISFVKPAPRKQVQEEAAFG